MTHFFDMDGTLAVYEPEIFQTQPWYENLPPHYFANLPPISSAVNYILSLLEMDRRSIYVCTTVAILDNDKAFYEITTDKIRWIQMHLKGRLLADHFLVARLPRGDNLTQAGSYTKSAVAMARLERPLQETDYLYDDFNPNLNDWRDHGGTPIKVLNGINSYRDDMNCISFS